MKTANSDVAGFTDAATKNAPQHNGPFVRIFHAVQQSRMEHARRVIARYSHLLPEG
jgi:hypothetical protein